MRMLLGLDSKYLHKPLIDTYHHASLGRVPSAMKFLSAHAVQPVPVIIMGKSSASWLTRAAAFLLGMSKAFVSAQTSPDCLLSGPIYPVPVNPLNKSTAVPQALDYLTSTLDSAGQNGTLGATNSTFHTSVFSTD
jgi:hypothetical protein